MNTRKKEKVGRLIAIATVLIALSFLSSCQSLWSTSGAGIGAGLGAVISPPAAIVGAVAGSLGGSLVEEENRTEAAEQMTRDVVEQLIATSSEEAKAAALDMVTESSESVLDEVRSFIASLFKWLAVGALVYFAAKLVLNRRQEKAIVERVKKLVGDDAKNAS